MDLLGSDWPVNPHTSPATITMDGSPIHDILSTVQKQLETLKTVFTSQNDIITEMKRNEIILKDQNIQLEERLKIIEKNENPLIKLMPMIENTQQDIIELKRRPIIDPEQTHRLENVEKKLLSFYGTDTNILGRVGHLEEGRYRDQESIANSFTQIKLLTDQITGLKKETNDLKQLFQTLQPNPSSFTPPPSSKSEFEDRFLQLERQIQDITSHSAKKEEIIQVKDLINYVANGFHGDIEILRKGIEQQAIHLSSYEERDKRKVEEQRSDERESEKAKDRDSNIVLTRLASLERKVNRIEDELTPLMSLPNEKETDKQRERELQELSYQVHSQKISLEDTLKKVTEQSERTKELNLSRQQQDSRYAHEQEAINQDLLQLTRKLQELAEKTLPLTEIHTTVIPQIKALQKEVSSLSLQNPGQDPGGHVTPPLTHHQPILHPLSSTSLSYATPSIQLLLSPSPVAPPRPISPRIPSDPPTNNYVTNEAMEDRLRFVVEELQKVLTSSKRDTQKRLKDMEKTLQHCDSCHSSLITSLSASLPTNTMISNLFHPSPFETKNEESSTGKNAVTINKDAEAEAPPPTPLSTLHTHQHGVPSDRLVKRKCLICQQKEIMTIVQKEYLERFNFLTSEINRWNKKYQQIVEKYNEWRERSEAHFAITTRDNQEIVKGMKILQEMSNGIIERIVREKVDECEVRERERNQKEIERARQRELQEFNEVKYLISEVKNEVNELRDTKEKDKHEAKESSEKLLRVQLQQQDQLNEMKRGQFMMKENFAAYLSAQSATPKEIPVAPVVTTPNITPALLANLVVELLPEIRGELAKEKENSKNLRPLIDEVREQMNRISTEYTQQLNGQKTQLQALRKEISENIMKKLQTLTAPPDAVNSSDVLERLENDVTKIQSGYKVLEKRIHTVHDKLEKMQADDRDRERVIEKEREVGRRSQEELSEILKRHIEDPRVHAHHSTYIPSFPTTIPVSVESLDLLQQHSQQGHQFKEKDEGDEVSRSPTFPLQFRSNIQKASHIAPDISESFGSSSPHPASSPYSRDDAQQQTEDFEAYVRDTLHSRMRKKSGEKGKGISPSPSSYPRRSWNPRSYTS